MPGAAQFTSTNLAVVRVGDGAAAIVSGVAQAVYVDEYSTAGNLVQSIPVVGSVSVNGTVNACTLSAVSSSTWLYDQEGIPSLSTNGTFLTFPCFKVTAGSSLVVSATKVAAIVSYTAAVSTATSALISAGAGTATTPFALRATVSNGVGVWWGLQTGFTPYSTMQYQAIGTTVATVQCDFSNYIAGALLLVILELCKMRKSFLSPFSLFHNFRLRRHGFWNCWTVVGWLPGGHFLDTVLD